MFTFSVVFVCELVSMPTVGYKTQVSYKSNVVSNLCFPFYNIIYTSIRARALHRGKNMAHTYVLFFFIGSVITCAPV